MTMNEVGSLILLVVAVAAIAVCGLTAAFYVQWKKDRDGT